MHSYMTCSAAKKAVVSASTMFPEAPPTSKNVCSNSKTTATHKTRKGKTQIIAPVQPPSQDFNIFSNTAAKAPASSANTQLSKLKHSSKKILSAADLGRKRSTSVTNINITHMCRTQQTLPKPLTTSVINELETKSAPRLTVNEKLHNPHSGVHKALPERSTKLTTEDPNVQLNSVRGILNTPAHTGPTASATPASNKSVDTTNNEEDCQSTAEVLRSIVTSPVQDSKAKHHLAYTNFYSISYAKLKERLLKVRITKHPNDQNLINDTQDGFREMRSCLTNLLDFFGEVNRIYDRTKAVDLVYLDFQKAFDKVPHERLMAKVEAHGIRGNYSRWIRNWLTGRTQRVVIHNETSDSALVTSGVSQGPF
ncbi:Reverse transcriptase domain [Trinorchestia longiramus]|nr:Reverse transcriptase domain [Trinorchestia longiramus]